MIDYLANAAAGALINLGVSGIVGQIMGAGVVIGFNPPLMLMGVVLGGALVSLARLADEYEKRPKVYLVVDNTGRC